MGQERANLPGLAGQHALVEKSPANVWGDSPVQRPVVILLSGGNDVGATTYRSLIKTIRHEARVMVKNLEAHALAQVLPVYEFEQEIAGLRDAVDAAGIRHFHAVGYSGGGSVCLAFAAEYPERLQSLALIEPAWMGNQEREPTEAAYWEEMDHVMALPPDEQAAAFLQLQVSADADLSQVLLAQSLAPVRERFARVWMMNQAFKRYHLEQERLRRFGGPVYVGLGSLSNPLEQRKAQRLTGLFPDIRVEVYEGLHHFHPPQEAEPERFARALRDLWARSTPR